MSEDFVNVSSSDGGMDVPGRKHFNDISTLAKERIFSYLSEDDLRSARQVCHSWLELVNESHGINCIIDNRNMEIISTSSWIVGATLKNLTRPIPDKGPIFAQRLKTLKMHGVIVSYNLIPIFTTCENLESLSIDDPTVDLPFSLIMSLAGKKKMKLPKCRTLELTFFSFNDSVNTIVSLMNAIQFGCLKNLTMQSIHPPPVQIPIFFTQAKDENLSFRGNSLMTLILDVLYGLETLSVGTVTGLNKFSFIQDESAKIENGFIQLEEVQIPHLLSTWTPILRQQAYLTVLVLGHCQTSQWSEVRACIARCAPTLRRILLQGRVVGVPWDCDVFAECFVLEELHLNYIFIPKRNLSSLPRSLTVLMIDGPLELPELRAILQLTLLRYLRLSSIGFNILNFFIDEDNPPPPNPDTVDLRLFIEMVTSLRNLETLIFTECSEDGLDWTAINDWCNTTHERFPMITFRSLHSNTREQHGLLLEFPTGFDRALLTIPQAFPEPSPAGVQARNGNGVFGGIFRVFGF